MNQNKNNHSRFKSICLYFVVFFAIVVCCIIVALILANRVKYGLILERTPTLILTIIGFLFAFAGINIYSIFNTNIDEEKNQLKALQKTYKDELEFTKTQWDYSIMMLRFHQTSQLVTNSKSYNFQLIDWLISLDKDLNGFSDYLISLYKNYHEEQFYSFRRDFKHISRGVGIQLNSLYERITDSESTFFKDSNGNDINNEDKQNCINRLNDLIMRVESIEDEDFKDALENPEAFEIPENDIKFLKSLGLREEEIKNNSKGRRTK